MAEQDNGHTESAGGQTSIPKYRLAEEVQKRLKAEAEVNALRQVLNATMQPKGEPKVERLPPEIEALKDQNPGMYNYLRNQEMRIKETNALLFDQADKADRMAFLTTRKKEGEKWLPDVERVLEQQRRQGNMFSRDQIFHFLKGSEALLKDEEQPTQETKSVDAPPAQVLPQATGSTASQSSKALTLEEMEQRLSNIEF